MAQGEGPVTGARRPDELDVPEVMAVARHGADGEVAVEAAPVVLRLPSPLRMARHALPSVIEGVIAPFAVFYAVLVLFGFRGALIAAVIWSSLTVGRRLARRERLPALLVLGILLLAVRTSIAFLTGSAFFYFMQPALGTFLVGLLFAGSALVKRPLIERLATEFCPLDVELMARPCMRRFFLRLSALWCAVMTVNAGLALYFLVESSLRAFLVERAVTSYTLTTVGILVSTGWFVLSMKKAGIAVRFRRHQVVAAGAVA
jgi:intracellular septation protein A